VVFIPVCWLTLGVDFNFCLLVNVGYGLYYLSANLRWECTFLLVACSICLRSVEQKACAPWHLPYLHASECMVLKTVWTYELFLAALFLPHAVGRHKEGRPVWSMGLLPNALGGLLWGQAALVGLSSLLFVQTHFLIKCLWSMGLLPNAFGSLLWGQAALVGPSSLLFVQIHFLIECLSYLLSTYISSNASQNQLQCLQAGITISKSTAVSTFVQAQDKRSQNQLQCLHVCKQDTRYKLRLVFRP